MRKHLFILGAVLLFFSAQAQTEKGNVLLGGSIGYQYNKISSSDHSAQTFNITPNIGIFIANDIAIGAQIGYAYAQQHLNDASSEEMKQQAGSFGFSPFARWYKGSNVFKFFGQVSVPMAWGNTKIDGEKVTTNSNYGVQLSPGLAVFPNRKLGIELIIRGLYYTHSTSKFEGTYNNDKTTANSFGLTGNFFAPQLGVQFYF